MYLTHKRFGNEQRIMIRLFIVGTPPLSIVHVEKIREKGGLAITLNHIWMSKLNITSLPYLVMGINFRDDYATATINKISFRLIECF